MQNASEDGYQIAMLVVLVLTALVVLAYALIFINPRVALNPFKPPLELTPTVAIAAVSTLPPTWTPTETVAPTSTAMPTSTPTLAAASATALPARAATARPPTHTPAPPTATSLPPTSTASAVAPTPIPLPYSFRPVLQSCTHSGSAVIKGRVMSGGGPVEGARVRLATGSDPASVQEEQIVRLDTTGSTTYAFIVPPPDSGSFPWHVWVVDTSGSALSDPNFQISINNLPADNPDSCWLAVVDFVK